MTRRDWEKARRVPPELQAELTKAEVLGVMAWAEARRNSDFEAFLPYLEKNVELKHRYLECFKDTGSSDYDILLDDYQEGRPQRGDHGDLRASQGSRDPLIRQVKAAEPGALGLHHTRFSRSRSRKWSGGRSSSGSAIRRSRWRLDPTIHPFATSISVDDIRLTTRYSEADAESIFHTAHEFGHGIYENGIDRSLERTPLVELNSMVLHESQTRLWENLVCRSRPFWRYFFPRIHEVFPEQLEGVTDEMYWRYVNRVEPGFIRVEADEVTYGMHIILRYELEQEIITGHRGAPRSTSTSGTRRCWSTSGSIRRDDAHGVLQDVRWSGGSFGYFPTYLLGTIASVQIGEKVRSELPDLDSQMEAGELGPCVSGSASTCTAGGGASRRTRCWSESSADRWTSSRTWLISSRRWRPFTAYAFELARRALERFTRECGRATSARWSRPSRRTPSWSSKGSRSARSPAGRRSAMRMPRNRRTTRSFCSMATGGTPGRTSPRSGRADVPERARRRDRQACDPVRPLAASTRNGLCPFRRCGTPEGSTRRSRAAHREAVPGFIRSLKVVRLSAKRDR